MTFALSEISTSSYKPIPDEECSYDDPPKFRKSRHRSFFIIFGLTLVLVLISAYTYGYVYGHYPIKTTTCLNPTTRREWRTLTIPQRHAYITAVQCLKTHPSRIGENHTLYDDFPWIHSRVGAYGTTDFYSDNVMFLLSLKTVHDAAPFVAWHRYFVHIYESTLREKCGYTGSMP